MIILIVYSSLFKGSINISGTELCIAKVQLCGYGPKTKWTHVVWLGLNCCDYKKNSCILLQTRIVNVKPI